MKLGEEPNKICFSHYNILQESNLQSKSQTQKKEEREKNLLFFLEKLENLDFFCKVSWTKEILNGIIRNEDMEFRDNPDLNWIFVQRSRMVL